MSGVRRVTFADLPMRRGRKRCDLETELAEVLAMQPGDQPLEFAARSLRDAERIARGLGRLMRYRGLSLRTRTSPQAAYVWRPRG